MLKLTGSLQRASRPWMLQSYRQSRRSGLHTLEVTSQTSTVQTTHVRRHNHELKNLDGAYFPVNFSLVYPNDDDGVLHLFSLIVSKYGFQWLERLQTQDVQWVRGANAAATAVVDGIKHGNSSRVLTFTAPSFSPEAPTFVTRQPEAPEQFVSWGPAAWYLRDNQGS
ncbi:hypothetical protein EK21DRAFT_90146 [Setomelanomma holmii]|uniref:Uncharacterized protein n=1 Tax=Setomelanomma holmii TaxID=210430 RepID=A0A9P4H9I5_9PLEO|nr:hypothetical protein EK21DRAFT_90146 [Setomelanomma holmii]